MNTYEYKIKLEAKDSNEAKQAIEAMFAIKKGLTHADLLLFAKIVKEKPNLIQKAKRWL